MIWSRRHLQLVLAVDGRGGEEDVDPRLLGVLERLPGAVDVACRCTGPGRRRSSRSTSVAMARTASKSPGEAIGNPASMMSTPSAASARATSSFSARFMLAPGDCSPSRSVVSKIRTRSEAASGETGVIGRGAHGWALSWLFGGSISPGHAIVDSKTARLQRTRRVTVVGARNEEAPRSTGRGGSRGFVVCGRHGPDEP